MRADTSLRADLHRVKPGQRAYVTLEAYPDSRLAAGSSTSAPSPASIRSAV